MLNLLFAVAATELMKVFSIASGYFCFSHIKAIYGKISIIWKIINKGTYVTMHSKKEWLNQQERKESIMKKLITGTHHTAMRFNGEEKLNRALSLYTDVLGLDIIRKWGEGTGTGVMVNTGDSIIEMFADASEQRTDGVVEHIALATDDVDACVAAVRAAGCEITKEPCDIVIPSEPAFPARIAFFRGLGGEMIELFCEK